MAIEELFYALLPYYADELPSDIVRVWEPPKIMRALLECNPLVESYQQVVIHPAGGEAGPPLFTGHQTPVSRTLLRQYYHKLGHYLHAPRTGRPHDVKKMRAVVASATLRVEQHCRETTVIHNGGMFVETVCDCGRKIKRNVLALVRPVAQCPDESCGAIYDLVAVQPGVATFWRLRTVPFSCANCDAKTDVPVHHLALDETFSCGGCGTEYVIRVGPYAQVKQENAPENGAA